MSKIKYFLVAIIITGLAVITGRWLWAAYETVAPTYETESVSQEIKDLNNDIADKKESLDKLQAKQQVYQREIKDAQAKKSSLENQLSILNNRLAEAELSIEEVKLNIDQINLEIKKTDLEIRSKEEKVNKEKEQLALALKLLYQQGDKTALEIILSYDNFSEYIDQIKYLTDINSGITDSLEELRKNQEQLVQDKLGLEAKREGLSKFYDDLENKQNALSAEQGSKNYLLTQTQSSEKEYQRLLALAKKEQEAAANDIVRMEKAVRERLARMEGNQLEEGSKDSTGMIWPVPQNNITAYFHDPDYPYRNIFEHPAVDIRAKQGTQVQAADYGYVARVKYDGSTSYAYIMIVHDNGLATVYGHISKAYVQENEYVSQGQAIALSGATPGTPGAGPLTTGPHLHFEVRLNGIPVNPLEYLP